MTKTDAAVQTLSEINPDVVLEVGLFAVCHLGFCFKGKFVWGPSSPSSGYKQNYSNCFFFSFHS